MIIKENNMDYKEKLKDPRWQKRRLKILERDNWKCSYCKDDKTQLQIHHTKYNGEPWEVSDDLLITLCYHCHEIIEAFKKSKTNHKIEKINKRNFNDTSLVLVKHGKNIGSMWHYTGTELNSMVFVNKDVIDFLK